MPNKKAAKEAAFCRLPAGFSGALDLFEHLESALGSTGKHALENLGEATTLKRVATDAFTFGHDGSPDG
jgi:hypothetical protein